MGSSAAMCSELFSPHLFWGPVQALRLHSPEPRPLQEERSQCYSLEGSISQKSFQQGSDLSSSGYAAVWSRAVAAVMHRASGHRAGNGEHSHQEPEIDQSRGERMGKETPSDPPPARSKPRHRIQQF